MLCRRLRLHIHCGALLDPGGACAAAVVPIPHKRTAHACAGVRPVVSGQVNIGTRRAPRSAAAAPRPRRFALLEAVRAAARFPAWPHRGTPRQSPCPVAAVAAPAPGPRPLCHPSTPRRRAHARAWPGQRGQRLARTAPRTPRAGHAAWYAQWRGACRCARRRRHCGRGRRL